MILPETPVASFEDYVAAGGGEALRRATAMSPEQVTAEVTRSGLRGRGGAGFPTGVKWASVVEAAGGEVPTYFVCNGAEGEPGTFKDRTLLQRTPYLVLEGVLIAAYATRAEAAYIGVKEKFVRERDRLADALAGAQAAGWPGSDRVVLVAGPDEYLFGEEKALLEVIEGKLPFPRILPPYQQGLFATMQSPNPTAANNVETCAHVATMFATSVDRWRSVGTDESPGTLLFTVVGDVANAGVYELPLGTPLRTLLHDIAGAEEIQAVYSGTSNPVITPALLDLPLDFDSFREAGLGLGSGGFMVYGPQRDIVQVLHSLAHFLAIESCGQCLACKLGTTAMADALAKILRGEGDRADVDEIRRRCDTVTDGNRCYLPVGAALTIGSTVEAFYDAFVAHVGVPADPAVAVDVPKIVDLDPDSGVVTLDLDYRRKRSDWSYADA